MLGLFLGKLIFGGAWLGFGLSIKTAKNTKENNLKQLTVTVYGLIFARALEGYLCLRFGGLIIGIYSILTNINAIEVKKLL